MLDDQTIAVTFNLTEVNAEVSIAGKRFIEPSDHFVDPIESNKIDIFTVSTLEVEFIV